MNGGAHKATDRQTVRQRARRRHACESEPDAREVKAPAPRCDICSPGGLGGGGSPRRDEEPGTTRELFHTRTTGGPPPLPKKSEKNRFVKYHKTIRAEVSSFTK